MSHDFGYFECDLLFQNIFPLFGFRPSLSVISGFVIGDKNSAHFNFSGLESIKHKCNAVLPSSSTILGSHLKSEKKNGTNYKYLYTSFDFTEFFKKLITY